MNALRLCKIPSASHVLLTGGMEGNAKIWVGDVGEWDLR